jgi:hypothetical protein
MVSKFLTPVAALPPPPQHATIEVPSDGSPYQYIPNFGVATASIRDGGRNFGILIYLGLID